MGIKDVSAAQTGHSRVFIIEGRARPDHSPSYEYLMRMGGLTRGYGDSTPIEAPDPYRPNEFIEIGKTKGGKERGTTTLESRYARNIKSTLMDLAAKGCSIDVQLNIGACVDPSNFNDFEKKIILEEVDGSSYSTEDLGALASADRNPVNESLDISAKEIYEVLPITFGQKAGALVTNELVDAALCDSPSCGDCEDESDGCEKIFAISLAAGGSPGTPPDVVFTTDGGTTWYAHDIETMLATEDPSGVACVGDYLVVVSNDTASGGSRSARGL